MNKNEKGMLVIEATIVFPVIFLGIFFLIFMGNAYFQKCKVEAIVAELTQEGAAYCADPTLESVEESGSFPAFGDVDVKPYRYLLGEMKNVESKIGTELESQLNGVTTGLFSAMKPKISSKKVKANNYLIYATFCVDVEYSIPIPVRLLGAEDFFSLSVEAHAERPVNDVPEFIRNINMVEDYLEQTGAMAKMEEAIKKVKDFVSK